MRRSPAGGVVIVQRRRSTPSTAATGGGIAGGTTTRMTPVLALASASVSTPTAAATMAIARHPFNQEVEDRRAKSCLMTMTGGWIASGTTRTTALTSASALVSAPTAAATMAIVRCPFAQEVEDCGAEPRVRTTSRVSRDDYK